MPKRHMGWMWRVGRWRAEAYLDFHGLLFGVNWWTDEPVAVYVHIGPIIIGVFLDKRGVL